MWKSIAVASLISLSSACAVESFYPVIYGLEGVPCPCDRAEILRQVAAQPDLYPGEQLALVAALEADRSISAPEVTKVLLTLLSSPSTYYGTKDKIMCLLSGLGLSQVQELQIQAAVNL